MGSVRRVAAPLAWEPGGDWDERIWVRETWSPTLHPPGMPGAGDGFFFSSAEKGPRQVDLTGGRAILSQTGGKLRGSNARDMSCLCCCREKSFPLSKAAISPAQPRPLRQQPKSSPPPSSASSTPATAATRHPTAARASTTSAGAPPPRVVLLSTPGAGALGSAPPRDRDSAALVSAANRRRIVCRDGVLTTEDWIVRRGLRMQRRVFFPGALCRGFVADAG